VAYACRAARISCACYLPPEAIAGVVLQLVWYIPAQVSGFRSRCRCGPGRQAVQSSPVGGTDMAQLAINSGEPSQAAEAAVCRLHAVCRTRRHQWQYLGTSVGGAGVLLLLVKIGRRPGRPGDLAICLGARRPRRVGDMRCGLERRPCPAPAVRAFKFKLQLEGGSG
jgi:hypothetical protein